MKAIVALLLLVGCATPQVIPAPVQKTEPVWNARQTFYVFKSCATAYPSATLGQCFCMSDTLRIAEPDPELWDNDLVHRAVVACEVDTSEPKPSEPLSDGVNL